METTEPVVAPPAEVDDTIAVLYSADRQEVRSKLYSLESKLLQFPQRELPLEHLFAHGVYARQMFIPKGTLLTGKIHKFSHINVVLKGDISVATESGVQRIKAPAIFVAEPGTKRAGFAHEDTIFINFHGTFETDVEKLEDELVTNDYQAYLEHEAKVLALKES
jgi:quercetin dioxygenase-like cupin family protein